jgi:single-strand DNA-binding protein
MKAQITVVGNVGREPELRFTKNGLAVCKFSLAVQERYKDQSTGQWEDGNTTWYEVSAWGNTAEAVADDIHKGMRVVVIGSFKVDEYETRDGEKRLSPAINAEAVGHFPWKKSGGRQRTMRGSDVGSAPF